MAAHPVRMLTTHRKWRTQRARGVAVAIANVVSRGVASFIHLAGLGRLRCRSY